MPTFTCLCCRHIVPVNPRAKNQQYCGKPACQRARKTKWQKAKLLADQEYLENQRNSCRKWREANRDYWRERRKAARRSVKDASNTPRKMDAGTVNMDALSGQGRSQNSFDISREYILIPLSNEHGVVGMRDVNMDALRVKFAAITAT